MNFHTNNHLFTREISFIATDNNGDFLIFFKPSYPNIFNMITLKPDEFSRISTDIINLKLIIDKK